jgi:hypothetical protein
MNIVAAVKTFAPLALLLTFLVVLPVARADDQDQATQVTFNQPVEISGRVLPAGTYCFVVAKDVTQHDQVRIYNSDRTMYYGTVLTISAQRLQATDESVFTFASREPAQPQAVVYWFYPGNTIGREFLYSSQMRDEYAKAKDKKGAAIVAQK